jgi:uncharacterized membrane protein
MRTRSVLVYAIVAIALVIGIYARVTHIDTKLFFQDEAFTALRVSGHSERAYRAEYFTGAVHTAGEFTALMTRDPRTGVGSVVALLAAEDPHHAPLYYVLDRLTIDALGSSIVDYRAVSVLFGLLAIAAAYFFGVTALGSRIAGGTLAALVAVSPFHVLYAQMAREYSLFACIVLLSSACAIRAIAKRQVADYVAYAVTVALGVYTDPLFALVVVAQAICAIFALRRDRRALVAWLAAAIVGAALYAPWAANSLSHHGNIEDQLAWGATVYPVFALAQKWAFNVGAVFFDAEFAKLSLAPIALVAIAIAASAGVYAIVRAEKSPAIVLGLALACVPVATFVTLDAIAGSHFATIPRYLSAAWLGIEILTAAALVAGFRSARARGLAIGAFAFLVAAGSTSAYIDSGYVNWWSNNDQVAFQLIAHDIDAANDPLLISQAYWHVPLVLAWYLKPSVPLLLFIAPKLPPIPHHAATFLITPTQSVRAAVGARLGPHAILQNVSPQTRTAIAAFHAQLHAATGARPAPDYSQAMSPDNALWRVVPART